MFIQETEFYTPDQNTELLSNKNGLVYYYHNLSKVVTVCDEEENAIITQKGFCSKKQFAVDWVEAQ